eukprot:TRINITY_DN11304_c0_g1_i2.p1 TRINITY_DN11304_c0_g1~~TRINITY_DN11304_c0_g1_i2.p1  ORF type:complete len:536 (-),score=127.95 TRINITY_DN11304_c0_g1_i2:52-1473(-)
MAAAGTRRYGDELREQPPARRRRLEPLKYQSAAEADLQLQLQRCAITQSAQLARPRVPAALLLAPMHTPPRPSAQLAATLPDAAAPASAALVLNAGARRRLNAAASRTPPRPPAGGVIDLTAEPDDEDPPDAASYAAAQLWPPLGLLLDLHHQIAATIPAQAAAALWHLPAPALPLTPRPDARRRAVLRQTPASVESVLVWLTRMTEEGRLSRRQRQELLVQQLEAAVTKPLPPDAELAPLDAAAAQAVAAMLTMPRSTVIADCNGDQVTREQAECLKPGKWLNSDVINYYIALVLARKTSVAFHVFSTFFFTKLTKEGRGFDYSSVQKWTRRIDLFACSKVLVPLHLNGNHWALGVIDLSGKRFEVLDSLCSTREAAQKHASTLKALRQYIEAEWQDKKKQTTPLTTGWDAAVRLDAPQQQNGHDCGVFMCKAIECITRGAALAFGQENMGVLRQSLLLAVASGQLRNSGAQ